MPKKNIHVSKKHAFVKKNMHVSKKHTDAKKTHRCAWLGELDSAEESDEISNEFDFKNEVFSFTHFFGGSSHYNVGGIKSSPHPGA